MQVATCDRSADRLSRRRRRCVSDVCSEMEEELEFQEFKRSYLKGMVDDEEEDGNVSGGDDMAPKEK